MTYLSPGHMTLATLSYIISTASRRPYIKFTMEREEDGTPLQDVLVTHNPQSHTIQTTVYRKPTDISTIDLTTPLLPRMYRIIQILLHQSKRPYAWIQTQKDEVSHLPTECIAIRPTSSTKLLDLYRPTGNNWNHEQPCSFLMLRELIVKRSSEYVLRWEFMFTSVPTEQLHGSLLGRVRPHTGIQQESSASLLRTVTTSVGETGRTIKKKTVRTQEILPK